MVGNSPFIIQILLWWRRALLPFKNWDILFWDMFRGCMTLPLTGWHLATQLPTQFGCSLLHKSCTENYGKSWLFPLRIIQCLKVPKNVSFQFYCVKTITYCIQIFFETQLVLKAGPYAVVDELVMESSSFYYSVTFCSFLYLDFLTLSKATNTYFRYYFSSKISFWWPNFGFLHIHLDLISGFDTYNHDIPNFV